jgi:hypothetical protein
MQLKRVPIFWSQLFTEVIFVWFVYQRAKYDFSSQDFSRSVEQTDAPPWREGHSEYQNSKFSLASQTTESLLSTTTPPDRTHIFAHPRA